MADVQPFKAWKFNIPKEQVPQHVFSLAHNIKQSLQDPNIQLPSPHAFQSIQHFNTNQVPPIIEEWITSGKVSIDSVPAIYPYTQEFKVRGSNKIFCRKGFLCRVKTDSDCILPHEEVNHKRAAAMAAFFQKEKINFTPVHGMYRDQNKIIDSIMFKHRQVIVFDFLDSTGMKNTISAITDTEDIETIHQFLLPQKIVIADGHHRYEAYKQSTHFNSGYGLFYLSNIYDNDLFVLPRKIYLSDLKLPQTSIKEVYPGYDLIKVKNQTSLECLLNQMSQCKGLRFNKQHYLLKPKISGLLLSKINQQSKKSLLYRKKEILKSKNVKKSSKFTINLNTTYKFKKGSQNILFEPIRLTEIVQKALKNCKFKPKTTFFYPKMNCGLIIDIYHEQPNND